MSNDQMQLKWQKCVNDQEPNLHWCSFKNLTLPLTGKPGGVYIIWHEGNPSQVVYVGQGNISDRLEDHRANDIILQYGQFGTLRVTWTTVEYPYREAVEAFLINRLNPLANRTPPQEHQIFVNLPW